MDRPHRDPGGYALTVASPLVRHRLRLFAAAIGVLALAALWRGASLARRQILAEADARAARLAAGYLGVLSAVDRRDRSSPEMRLLSAAGGLAGARFWGGGLQVWLSGTPLLVADTAGQRVASATFAVGDSVHAGRVAVWATVPALTGAPLIAVGGGFAVAALLLVASAGEFMRIGRPRAVVAALGLLIVGAGALGQARGVYATARVAQDAGLLKARRLLEITASGRRVNDAEVTALGGGLRVTPLRGGSAIRDTAVARDTAGAHLVAVAGRGQAWEVSDPDEVEGRTADWRLLLGCAVVALLAGFVAAALPPGARYLSASPSDPPTPT